MKPAEELELKLEEHQLIESIMTRAYVPREYCNLILETLKRIPRRDLEKINNVFEQFIFYESGSIAGADKINFVCSREHKKKVQKFEGEPLEWIEEISYDVWIVVLIEDAFRGLSKAARIAVIAQELAHVYLKQDRWVSSKSPLDDEDKAEKKVLEWGFEAEAKAYDDETKTNRPERV